MKKLSLLKTEINSLNQCIGQPIQSTNLSLRSLCSKNFLYVNKSTTIFSVFKVIKSLIQIFNPKKNYLVWVENNTWTAHTKREVYNSFLEIHGARWVLESSFSNFRKEIEFYIYPLLQITSAPGNNIVTRKTENVNGLPSDKILPWK